jgi:hypothetical protein
VYDRDHPAYHINADDMLKNIFLNSSTFSIKDFFFFITSFVHIRLFSHSLLLSEKSQEPEFFSEFPEFPLENGRVAIFLSCLQGGSGE